MKKKLLALSFLITSSLVFLPGNGMSATSAAAAAKTSPPQIRVQVGGNRGRHNGWYRGHHYGWYNRNARMNRMNSRWYNRNMIGRRVTVYNRNGMVRQTYYVNGRRYTRLIRSY